MTTTTTPLATLLGLGVEVVTDDVSQPIALLSPPGQSMRIVAQRNGRIAVLSPEGIPSPDAFLDLTDRVNSNGIEQGLLGMAFHPDFARNGRFFVYYDAGGSLTRLSEFAASIDPLGAEPDSERPILEFPQPTDRHNGGHLEFGPDGFLWLGLGEGGKASIHSQDPNTLLSSILRLDVDSATPYAVPRDNPYVAGGGAPEVWAYGLRNPWRFSIDDSTEMIYIGDVGHEDIEEIDVVSLRTGAGSNFGWIRMEGSECFQRGCDPVAENLVLPVHEYRHDEGCSVIGGSVYRGAAIPELDGHYFYSDWCGGWLRSLLMDDGQATDHREWLTGLEQVNAFGTDSEGEFYLLTWTGSVLKVIPVRDAG
jgi:glucose/arabinose dehydrogenase